MLDGAKRSYTVHYRHALDVVRSLLQDPRLQEHFVWFPSRHYTKNPQGGMMRLYDELSSADDWWEFQVRYATSKLVMSSFEYSMFRPKLARESASSSCSSIRIRPKSQHLARRKKVWPVYLWLGNLPKSVRNSRGKGGAEWLGYLPAVMNPERSVATNSYVYQVLVDADDDSAETANHRAEIFHRALELMLDSLDVASHVSFLWYDKGVVREDVICLGVISIDYEEAYVLDSPPSVCVSG